MDHEWRSRGVTHCNGSTDVDCNVPNRVICWKGCSANYTLEKTRAEGHALIMQL